MAEPSTRLWSWAENHGEEAVPGARPVSTAMNGKRMPRSIWTGAGGSGLARLGPLLQLLVAFLLLPALTSEALAHAVAEGDKGYIQEITGVHLLPPKSLYLPERTKRLLP